ncbi:hypothetical protein AGR8A_pTi20041 [Agrobacterium fabrum str. J-07]|nr:hypothetical protein AGR8A_pTi20041 [Agrobacterium fabrum str. J-07]
MDKFAWRTISHKSCSDPIIAADNMIRPGSGEIRNYGRAVRDLPGVRSLLLPVGTGLEISILEASDPYLQPAPKEI